MESSDTEVLQTALVWLQQSVEEVALVTVLKTWGSAPRPVGSLLVMRRDKTHVGSVSGGCVEADLLEKYQNGQLSEFPTRINYGVKRVDAARLGLPCGGQLELLVEKLKDPQHLALILSRIKNQLLIARQVNLNTGEVTLLNECEEQSFLYEQQMVRKLFGPTWHMLLIGAGQLSLAVARLAKMLDYSVVICDPRSEYVQSSNLKDVTYTRIMPDDAVEKYANHTRCIVAALTHDPKLDDLALLTALSSTAFYVGAIGSRKSCAARRERLLSLGVPPEQLMRLHAPIGLPINSHTPAEIAISVMAEITALKNQRRSPSSSHISVG